MKEDCIIIGGGIGGLFTGALLSLNGVSVTVFEKNDIIGGGLQCFSRKGKSFETGMHIMGGFEEGGNLSRICRYLGILHKLKIHHIDSDCMDEVRFENSGKTYRIASGKENFIKRLSEYFPHEANGIRAYVEDLYSITEELPLFYLQPVPDGPKFYSDKFLLSADQLIEHHVSDPELRDLLAYLNPLYGGVKGHTPAFIHAIINVLYIGGASRFKGGSLQLAYALKDVIEENGGAVLNNKEVKKIEVEAEEIQAVETADGDRYSAKRYVSSIHPTALLKLLPEGVLGARYEKRLGEIPVSYSAFTLFIDFKPDSFEFIEHTCYYHDDGAGIWNVENSNNSGWPNSLLYLTPVDENQGKFAERMLVLVMMEYDEVRKWEDSKLGNRPPEYKLWKEEKTGLILNKLEKIYPGFKEKIENVYAASPLTIRDFYNTKEGSLYGYRKDCENFFLSQLTTFTKVKNLFLTGQNVYLHGICGVPMTAICTADAIIGRNNILNQLNDEK